MLEINDKKMRGQLLTLVFDKISSMTVQVTERLTPILRIVFSKIGPMPPINNMSINLDELPEFYGYFGLRADVESVLNHITKIKNNVTKPEFHFPLDELNLNPMDVDMDVLEEYFYPDAFIISRVKQN
jgi:hypothetical protein